jgi:hypothetical protein
MGTGIGAGAAGPEPNVETLELMGVAVWMQWMQWMQRPDVAVVEVACAHAVHHQFIPLRLVAAEGEAGRAQAQGRKKIDRVHVVCVPSMGIVFWTPARLRPPHFLFEPFPMAEDQRGGESSKKKKGLRIFFLLVDGPRIPFTSQIV